MNPIRSFEDLLVWQMAIELVKRIYLLTGSGPLKANFGLKDQMRRAAVSIPTNIAEGFERLSRKEYLLFLNIAKGSAGELEVCCVSHWRWVTLRCASMTSLTTRYQNSALIFSRR